MGIEELNLNEEDREKVGGGVALIYRHVTPGEKMGVEELNLNEEDRERFGKSYAVFFNEGVSVETV